MKETTITLKGVELQNFLPKEVSASFKITFERDGNQESMYKKLKLTKAEQLTKKILDDIKQRSKIELSETDDPLGSIFIVHLKNEDKTEEKLYNFLSKICEKSRFLKHLNNHNEYMKVYDEIKVQRLTF
jgi:hypothetical protein